MTAAPIEEFARARRRGVAMLCALAASLLALDVDAAPAPAATRDALFVANNWDGTADVIDPHSFERIDRIDIVPDKQQRLTEIMMDPEAQGYFLAIRELVGEGHDQFADDMFSSHDGRYLYVSRPSFADVVAFDLSTKRIVWRAKLEGHRADHMAISPDGTRLAVSASTARKVHMIDTATGKIVGSFESGDQPHENNFSADGSRIFHASIGTVYTPLDDPAFDSSKGDRWFEVVDANTLQVLKRVDIGEKLAEAGYPNMSSAVRPMAIAPGERYFYFQISFFHGFVEYDLQEDRILRVANLPLSEKSRNMRREEYLLDSAHHGLAINPAGTKLCAAGTMSDYVAVVSRATFGYTIIPVGSTPYWATNNGDGKLCFVSVSGDDRVAVISYADEKEVARISVGDHPQRMRMGRYPAAASQVGGRCVDRASPSSWLQRSRSRLARRGLVLRGRARDRCGISSAGSLARVRVAVARVSVDHRCRFVLASGRLGARRRCDRPVFRPARGGARWTLRLRRTLPPGRYRAQSQAADRAGNRERSLRLRGGQRNLLRFTLR